MSLLQIAEPGQSHKPHQKKWVVGIDLGTTHSLVAAMQHGEVKALPDSEGKVMLPSVFAINPQGEQRIGEAALSADDSFQKIRSIKRILGYSFDEIKQHNIATHLPIVETETIPAIETPAGRLNPVEISAAILTALKTRAEETLGHVLNGAVITVPAYFDETRRKATKDAATLAGISVLRLINEPTAAALAYGLDNAATGYVVVYDLGGGTFDISILALREGVFEVKATAGDIQLGGDDFDLRIVNWWLENRPELITENKNTLLFAAKKAKEALADTQSVSLTLPNIEPLLLSRSIFDSLIADLVEKSIKLTQQALADAGLQPSQIDHIVAVGGSTRVKSVQTHLKNLFQRDVLNAVDPDQVVAIGAAVAAENLSGNQENKQLLLDVTPLSLGVETAGELVEVIINRNSPIPITREQVFTTYKNGQTAMLIHVVQGERDKVSECRSLARFSLTDIPPMAAGMARIRIRFSIDADGLLTVSALEESTGHSATVSVTPSYGLSEDDISNMLRASLAHAGDDLVFRQLMQARVEAERVLDALRTAIAEDAELLKPEEADAIVNAVANLEAAIAGEDSQFINQQVSTLEKTADAFIERRMNAAINRAIAGHSIDQF